jgi:hypothetical protein
MARTSLCSPTHQQLRTPTRTLRAHQPLPQLRLYEIDPDTGLEFPAVDDIPSIPGLQISLDVAEARVFLVGPKQSL